MSIIEFSSISFHYTQSTPRSGGIYLPGVAASALLLFYVLADAALLAETGITTQHGDEFVFSIAAFGALTLWIYVRRLDQRLGSIATAVSTLLAVALFGIPFAYGMAALSPFPLEDKSIFELDRLLGFDWRSFVALIDRYPFLCALLGFSYATIWLQVFAIVIGAVLCRDHKPIDSMAIAVGLSLILVNAIAYFVPTAGVTTLVSHEFINLDISGGILGRHDYLALRDGSLKILDFDHVAALVTFPSFHTVIAILAVLASRRIPYLFGPTLALNALMLISTLTHGGHYLSDVIVGVAIAVVSWRIAEASAKWSFSAFSRRTTNVTRADA